MLIMVLLLNTIYGENMLHQLSKHLKKSFLGIFLLCQSSYGMNDQSSHLFPDQPMGIEEIKNGFFWIREFDQNRDLISCDKTYDKRWFLVMLLYGTMGPLPIGMV